MRRILIDKIVSDRADEFANVLISKKPKLINWQQQAMPRNKLKAFCLELHNQGLKKHFWYVYRIYTYYKDLLTAHPKDFDDIKNKFFGDLSDKELDAKIDYSGKTQEFYKHVIDCMRYTDIRSNLMRYYMQQQKVKACVYCNAQYAITTDEFVDEDGKKKRIGTYQFDHFYPESKYPFLCTSYFNLQPSCPTCNDSKMQRHALFNLYTEDGSDLDVFWFDLTPLKALDDYMSDDMDLLQVTLNSNDIGLLENHQTLFHIDQIYSQHRDVIQRTILIMKYNNDTYRQSLSDGISELFPHGVEDPEYFFFGYYMKPENIHYQPLSKMVQDIVRVFRNNGKVI